MYVQKASAPGGSNGAASVGRGPAPPGHLYHARPGKRQPFVVPPPTLHTPRSDSINRPVHKMSVQERERERLPTAKPKMVAAGNEDWVDVPDNFDIVSDDGETELGFDDGASEMTYGTLPLTRSASLAPAHTREKDRERGAHTLYRVPSRTRAMKNKPTFRMPTMPARQEVPVPSYRHRAEVVALPSPSSSPALRPPVKHVIASTPMKPVALNGAMKVAQLDTALRMLPPSFEPASPDSVATSDVTSGPPTPMMHRLMPPASLRKKPSMLAVALANPQSKASRDLARVLDDALRSLSATPLPDHLTVTSVRRPSPSAPSTATNLLRVEEDLGEDEGWEDEETMPRAPKGFRVVDRFEIEFEHNQQLEQMEVLE
ncbi:hypothetical protein HK101_006397, partial [Irineochytrium annulatum]